MVHPLVKRSRKPQCSCRWASHLALMASQQKSVSIGEQCSVSSRICSQTIGRKRLYCRTSRMQSSSLGIKPREKNQPAQNTKASSYSPLQAISWLMSLLNRLIPTIVQENTPESQFWFKSNRGVTAEAGSGELQRTEHGSNCSFHRFDQGLWYCQPWRTVENPGALWLPSKNSHHCLPASWGSARSGEAQWVTVGQLPHLLQHEGCVRAPTLSSIFFSIMFCEAKEVLPDDIYICCWIDGSVFNLQCYLACMTTIEELITKLLFADDYPSRLHGGSSTTHCDLLLWSSQELVLTIGLKKTELLYQLSKWEVYSPSHISISGTNLNAVEHFTYLGSVIPKDATVSKDLDNHLFKASSSFGRLSKRAWQSHLLHLSLKIQVYRAIVVSILLYDAETWALYGKQIRLLECF